MHILDYCNYNTTAYENNKNLPPFFFFLLTFNFYGSKQHGLVFGLRVGSKNVWVLVTVAFICFIDYDDDADSCRYGNVTEIGRAHV